MLLALWKENTVCCGTILIILTICAYYAYRVNSRREPDDPKKRNYSPYAPWITPVSIPLILLFNLGVLILGSLLAAAFLIIFLLSLIFIRKPFLIKWILKHARKIGEKILKINTELLKLAGLHPS